MKRFAPLAALLAGVIGMAALGATALAVTRGPSGPAAAYASQSLGYSVQLPAAWRRSTALSALVNNGSLKVGHEVFTVRSTADEAGVLNDPGPGAAWSYVAVVEQWRDPLAWTPLAWATDPLLAGWAQGQVVENATIDGHVAAKVTNGPRFSVAYYVYDAGRMFVVGYKIDRPDWKPSAATESDLRAIVASFHITP
ncbi:MAG TPA: hypothetical protein VL333_02000 [Candidatus Saccharimonadales bacterium]|nr:hypothetical protein [Candidatus Saccharimonadales bacterium]